MSALAAQSTSACAPLCNPRATDPYSMNSLDSLEKGNTLWTVCLRDATADHMPILVARISGHDLDVVDAAGGNGGTNLVSHVTFWKRG